MSFSERTSSLPKSKRHEAKEVEVRFRRPNGDQAIKRAVPVRTKNDLEEGQEGQGGVSQRSLYHVLNEKLTEEAPLIS